MANVARWVRFVVIVLLLAHGLTAAATNEVLNQRRPAPKAGLNDQLRFTESLLLGASNQVDEAQAQALASAARGENGNGTWLSVLTSTAEWDTRHAEKPVAISVDGASTVKALIKTLMADPANQDVTVLKPKLLAAVALGFTAPEWDSEQEYFPGPLNVLACRIAQRYSVMSDQQPCPQYWVGVLADNIREESSFVARWMRSLQPASSSASAGRLDTKKGRCTVDRSGYAFDGGAAQPNASFDYEIRTTWSDNVPTEVTITIDLTPMSGALKPVKVSTSQE